MLSSVHGFCSQELTIGFVSMMPTHGHSSKNSNMNWGGALEATLLTEELLTSNGGY